MKIFHNFWYSKLSDGWYEKNMINQILFRYKGTINRLQNFVIVLPLENYHKQQIFRAIQGHFAILWLPRPGYWSPSIFRTRKFYSVDSTLLFYLDRLIQSSHLVHIEKWLKHNITLLMTASNQRDKLWAKYLQRATSKCRPCKKRPTISSPVQYTTQTGRRPLILTIWVRDVDSISS